MAGARYVSVVLRLQDGMVMTHEENRETTHRDVSSVPKASWEAPDVRNLEEPDIDSGSRYSLPEGVPTISGGAYGNADS
jgi:hypothetical protein